MRTTATTVFLLTLSVGIPSLTAAAPSPLPPADRTPVLRINPGGSAAPVTSVALSADGKTVTVAGLDKVVRNYIWKPGKIGGEFVEVEPIRVPLGPGNAGAINAIAVSPDGKWLAVAGRAPMRDEARFADDGIVIPTSQLPPVMRRDLGVIYIFDRSNPNGGKLLRGNLGEVRALAFADPSPESGPVLVSASIEAVSKDPRRERVGVVRVWDVAKASEIAARSGFPGTPTRPALAAWAEKDGIRTAISWSNPNPATPGSMVLWKVGEETAVSTEIGGYNLGLTVIRDKNRAVTDVVSTSFVSFRDGGKLRSLGRITRHPLASGGKPVTFEFPVEQGKLYLPLAVEALPETGGFAALFETAPPEADNPRPAVLRILDRDGKLEQELPIAKLSAESLPTLSVSADGKTLAIAGFDDNRVEVFSNKNGKLQSLGKIPGAIGAFRRVEFLAGGKLWLRALGDPLDGGTVFDPTTRAIQEKAPEQKLDSPKLPEGMELERRPGDVRLDQPWKPRNPVFAKAKLRPKQRPTVFAYLPAGPAWNKNLPDLVAVAHTNVEDRVTLISLHDAKSGEVIRQFAGPEQPVRWLAFSASRPLFAAVGDDPAVSVWSLKDLDKKVGTLAGLELLDLGNGPVIASISPDAKSFPAGLKKDDVIDAVGAEKGDLTPVKSLPELLWNVRSQPVGGQVAVRVKGNANRLLFPVVPAVEQRNPLFSLWISPGAKLADREWVGWSPHGPYDASSRDAESKIGWVTMTGNPANPITFAGADQYRKTYYRKDVLRFLAEKAELTAAIEAHTDAYPPPPPKLRVRVAGEIPQEAGLPLLREKSTQLEVNLSDITDDFPLDRAVLRWRSTGPDGKPSEWTPLPVAGQDRTFSTDLGKYPWSRGRHTFEATLHRTPTSPVAIAAAAEVRYVPTAPKLTATVAGQPAEAVVKTENNGIEVAAQVEPGSGGAADVTLEWTGPDGKTGSAPLAAKPANAYAPAEVKLLPGTTTVRLTATTRNAGEFAKLESHTAEFRVSYTPPKVILPPRIAGLELSKPTETREIDGKSVAISNLAKLTVSAELTADDPITDVEWNLGDGKWLAANPASPANSHTASREITLPAGKPQTVRIRSKCGKGPYAEREIAVAYHPPLPTVTVAPLEAGAAVTSRLLTLTGEYRPATDDRFQVQVLVAPAGSREMQSFDAVPNPAAKTWTATVALQPGVNRIGMVVRNDWRSEEFANLATIAYRQPPTLFSIAPVDAGERAVADVTAVVIAPDRVPPTEILVDGRLVESRPAKKLGTVFSLDFWEIAAPAVPVKTGEEWLANLRIAVRNADGDTPVSVVPVKRKIRVIPPPIVAIAEGTRDRTTDKPQIPLRFKVTSPSKLSRVEVWQAARGGNLERAAAIAIDKLVAGPDGFSTDAEVNLDLRAGVNRVRVAAVNDGGETFQEFAVSYTPPAFQVVIDGVEEILAGGRLTDPLPRKSEEYQARAGLVAVRGRIRWHAEDTPLARDPKLAAVLVVNEVEHLPVYLDPEKGRALERTFRVPIFLNAKDSLVRFEFRTPNREAAAPQQSLGGAKFRIHCENPLTEQRLHLVVVGVDVPTADRGSLAKRVVAALGGVVPTDRQENFDRGEFAHKAFSKSILYPPLVGEVDDGKVAWVLDEVNRELKRLGTGKADAWQNDVILLFYQGKDWIDPNGTRWLHTSRSLRYPESVASRFAIREAGLPRTPGVRFFVLQVANPVRGKLDPLADRSQVVLNRWKDSNSQNLWFSAMHRAVSERKSVGDVFDAMVKLLDDKPVDPQIQLDEALRKRNFGLAGVPPENR